MGFFFICFCFSILVSPIIRDGETTIKIKFALLRKLGLGGREENRPKMLLFVWNVTTSERIKHAPNWGPPFRVTFGPPFPGRGKRWIHAGDPCRNSKTSHRKGGEKGGFPVPEKGEFPLKEKGGAKVTQNGNHDLVQVWFSLTTIKFWKC